MPPSPTFSDCPVFPALPKIKRSLVGPQDECVIGGVRSKVGHMGKKKMSLYDSQAPVCPICQVLLRPGELQEHMETEIERLAAICLR
ncbi:hypothetical protein CRENBAI_001754 [Crenichthys baileyi]|uniref:E3 ubiquitin-protein ligase RNF220 middle domain-containing protein n=1 Tax=Crenichthys baileyi TaxID=28760 RepID=A0AAV9R233_9TELE